jgi:predicted Mrr-cat superfamily restriction endonuclease
MSNVWKIAPGYLAEDRDVSREKGSIALGWMRLRDFSKFRSEEHVLEALIRAWPDDEEGNRDGAARSIWYFVREVEPDDVIVANNGRGSVVGVGVVASDYLLPTSPENPVRSDKRVWRRHARRVEWVIRKAVALDDPFFFGINAVTSLSPKRVAKIRQAYARKYPELRKKLAELFG